MSIMQPIISATAVFESVWAIGVTLPVLQFCAPYM